MTNGRTRAPREIEADLDGNRARLSDTLEALQRRLSPEDLFNQALDYIRSSTGGEFASNFQRSVAQNRVPVTITGLGLAWLMVSSRGSADASASHMGAHVGHKMSSTTSKARDQTKTAARSARAGLEHMASSSREQMHQLSQGASRMGGMGRHQAARAKSGFEHMLNEQPLVLGAIGVALGVALAVGLPRTRREDEIMGEARDEIVDRAKEEGKEQLSKAQRVMESARNAAQEEAKREGLSREGIEEKANKVASAARDAAKDEADKQGLSHTRRQGSSDKESSS